MSFSMSKASLPALEIGLNALSGVLDKAQAFATAKKVDPSVLLATRLCPDMFALTRQVQIVSDTAKGAAARLAGVEAPKFEDTEASFAELKTRLDKTAGFLKGIDQGRFQGADTRPIELKFPSVTLNFPNGWNYLMAFALPNLYFHSATTYDILRHNGVKLGKPDFLGAVGRG